MTIINEGHSVAILRSALALDTSLPWAFRLVGFFAVSLAISACNGGSDIHTWKEGVFPEKDVFAANCAEPRSGSNPFDNNRPYPDQPGEIADENFWLRSWTHDLYLWYSEVEDQDPNLFNTADYFKELKTKQKTPSGSDKDNFHFSQDTFDYLNTTVAGITFGYGYRLTVGNTSPPREFRIADVVPGSPADLAGIQRGMLITSIDGADMINGNTSAEIDTLYNGLSPPAVGETHTFGMQSVGADTSVEFQIQSASIESVPVKDVSIIETASGPVGYIHFNSHIRPSEGGLFDAFNQLRGVSDLVLDLRYNGGGLLAIAAQVSYMIAGEDNIDNQSFYALTFNDQHPTQDPVTGATLRPIPFYDATLGFDESLSARQSLPSLNLSRVYVLTSSGTCSASETIMNGLRGIGLEVIQIGDTTCGKPYGFYPQDNCGTTYFSVQFAGVNAVGFGEYADGFSPANTPGVTGTIIPGCWVADDFTHVLGDPEEALLAAALGHIEDQSCPALPPSVKNTAPAQNRNKSAEGQPASGAITLPGNPGLENLILDVKR
ncbi:MAG: carboxyl-terminal processing protease [Lentisphaeria bacterium]